MSFRLAACTKWLPCRVAVPSRPAYRVAVILLLSIVFLSVGTAVLADAGQRGERGNERVGENGHSPEEPLGIAAVQFEIDETLVADEAAFVDAIATSVRQAASAGSDVVVFPEYVNVFRALSEYQDFLTAVESASITGQDLEYGSTGRDGWKTNPRVRLLGMLNLHTDYDTLRGLFLEEAGRVSRFMDRAYGASAEEYGIYVVAGSYFAADAGDRSGENISGGAERVSVERSGEPRLTNRLVVYGPGGERVYDQDKAFLTEFEQEIVGLDAGNPEDAEGIEINGWSVGVTICRDTYFDVWNDVHAERDVWLDLRGEGTEYDDSVRARLQGALPERLSDTGVPYGVTLFLTGEFYGLFWEGRSNVLRYTGEEVEYLQHADTSEGHDVVITELQPRE